MIETTETTEADQRQAGMLVLDAASLPYRQLNQQVRSLAEQYAHIKLRNLCGQRYIGTSLGATHTRLELHGTPGNDLGAFLNGADLMVYGNAQDGVGNTMSAGRIVVHGNAGDVAAMSMRGGRIFVRGDVGYRCALHMKECSDSRPAIVIGGSCQDFFGEYMAGGVAVLLGLQLPAPGFHTGRFLGTGMHGGSMFIRGQIEPAQLGKEAGVAALDDADWNELTPLLAEFAGLFAVDMAEITARPFIKVYPKNSRPYGKLYAY